MLNQVVAALKDFDEKGTAVIEGGHQYSQLICNSVQHLLNGLSIDYDLFFTETTNNYTFEKRTDLGHDFVGVLPPVLDDQQERWTKGNIRIFEQMISGTQHVIEVDVRHKMNQSFTVTNGRWTLTGIGSFAKGDWDEITTVDELCADFILNGYTEVTKGSVK